MIDFELQRFVQEAFAEGLRPVRRITVSEWADASRVLPRETTAEYGPWRTARVPFTREIMDSLSPLDPVQVVAVMKGAQIAATEIGLNLIGYTIEHDPGPMLLVVPSFGFAQRYSKRRIQPMIDASPALRARVSPTRSRDSGNTVFQKDFDGGTLIIGSSESPRSLSSDPCRRVMLDEIDRFDPIVGEEGSAIGLATVRTRNFPNRKIYAVSTPVLRSTSNIEPLFLSGDRRRYYIPCPHCTHMDFITWTGADPFEDVGGEHFKITWDEDRPETAAMLCPCCGVFIEEGHKTAMLAAGEWRATATCAPEIRSYHLPSMYSPLGWLSWSQMAREHLDAVHQSRRGSFSGLQQFVNLSLGEAWEEKGERVKPKTLLDRAELYAAPVPAGVGVLVASVDVQGDRLEAQVTGYGAGEESWLIEWRQFHGDPDSESLWFELDAYLQRTWRHESGRELPIERATVDSGGAHSERVYQFCKTRLERGVFAVRGGNEIAKPLVGRPTTNNKYGTPLFTLCVDTGKERVYARLKITERGAGRCHFPQAAWFDEEYVAQLTSEKKVRKFVRGRGWVPEWKKMRDRNEALDLTVYALAALYILGPAFIERLGEEAARWTTPLERGASAGEAPREPAPAPTVAPAHGPRSSGFSVLPPGSSWVTNWRG